MGGGRIPEGVSLTKSCGDHMEEIEAGLSEDLSDAKRTTTVNMEGLHFKLYFI